MNTKGFIFSWTKLRLANFSHGLNLLLSFGYESRPQRHDPLTRSMGHNSSLIFPLLSSLLVLSGSTNKVHGF